jgi:hypothetical protein
MNLPIPISVGPTDWAGTTMKLNANRKGRANTKMIFSIFMRLLNTLFLVPIQVAYQFMLLLFFIIVPFYSKHSQ